MNDETTVEQRLSFIALAGIGIVVAPRRTSDAVDTLGQTPELEEECCRFCQAICVLERAGELRQMTRTCSCQPRNIETKFLREV